ncbi:MAG: YSC84-related protein [Motiliproteus sp.]|nr:YSC84-related protein [Motiliproteus sp.]MCW9051491.1 YSC84-related protein [Motiliproteus sp.]
MANARNFLSLLALLVSCSLVADVQAGWNPFDSEKSENQGMSDSKVAKTIARFKNKDPNLKLFFSKAYGYAVFPTVGKGGIGIGGAYGEGKLYQQAEYAGDTTLTQLTIGLQLGGQAYSEIIFFKDKAAIERFKQGSFELNAQASAVAVTAGASTDADYSDGVAIFTMAKGGLMYEASVGGQKFSYTPAPKKSK